MLKASQWGGRVRGTLPILLLLLVGPVRPAAAAPPTISCPGPQWTYEGGGVYLFVSASDSDGDPVTLTVVNPPRRAAFDPESGLFQWVPDYAQAGQYDVLFRAVAGGQTVECTVAITVANFNRLPRITCPAPITGFAGEILRAQITATDIDGDSLFFSGVSLPSGATVSPSGAFTWLTGGVTPGTTTTIQVQVFDGTNSASCSFQVTVQEAAQGQPEMVCPGFVAGAELQPIEFFISATDPLGRPLSYSAENLPAGASFDPALRKFTWTPTATQSGTYGPRFVVTNNVNPPVACVVTVIVLDGSPPEISCPQPITVAERTSISFTVSATSPPGYPVTYTAENLPPGSSFSPASRQFSWTPSYDQSGSYAPRFVATTAFGVASCTVPIQVLDRPNLAPRITCPLPPTGVVDRSLTFRVTALDPDADAVALSARFLPAGATFTPATGTLNWTPTAGQGGRHVLEFIATDQEARDSCQVSIEVIDPGFVPGPIQPVLLGVLDVPADQGGWVRLRLLTPVNDSPGGSPQIVGYNVWRRVALPGQAVGTGRGELSAGSGLPPGTWESVGFTPAIQSTTMLLLAPTRADSSAAGLAREVYVVTGHVDSPLSWEASRHDSGWSVDNLAPAAPAGIVSRDADGRARLTWTASPDLDLSGYSVHVGEAPGFEPTPGNMRVSTRDTSWIDPDPRAGTWYRIVAHDVHGNASGSDAVASPGPGGVLPGELRLAPPRPSPSSGAVEFDLPADGPVRLSIHDARGRRVAVPARGTFGAGPHRLVWDARDDRGRLLPPGVYTIRLEAGGRTLGRKLIRL